MHSSLIRMESCSAFKRSRSLRHSRFTALGWNVDDIDAVIKELAGRGVEMMKLEFLPQDALGVWTTPEGSKIAWFSDPDGNTLSLAQMA